MKSNRATNKPVKISYRGPACPAIAIAGFVSLRLVSGYERGNSKAEFVGLVLEVLALRFGDFFSSYNTHSHFIYEIMNM